ncbi:MAG TPA: carboxypeptidase regulatory-like domain-containing protein, partial [Pyrinomonadaceae bacterium]
MGRLIGQSISTLILVALLLTPLTLKANAPQTTGELRGQVTDELGGLIVGASLTLTNAAGVSLTATTGDEGSYLFAGLAPGSYSLRVEARGFAIHESAGLEVRPGGRQRLSIKLSVALEKQEVSVERDNALSTAADNNASALVLGSAELEALPDDPDDLASALQALAGPSAGPDGGQILVDNFADNRLPAKSSIREIRINLNPFSAEYSRLGFGRIEIFTKPGTDRFHGQASLNFSQQSLNSRNPFAGERAPYRFLLYGGNLSGPVIAKRASFFLDFERRDINDNSIVNATILDSSLNVTQLRQALVTPQRRTSVSPRFDYQLNPKNTLVARYSFLHQTQQNAGVGNFSLITRAYDTAYTEQTVQLTETAVLNTRAVNEIRFQYSRQRNRQNGDNVVPTINVLDAFIGGGAQIGLATNVQDRFELQNNTTFALAHHTLRAGATLRDIRVSDISPVNFGGSFIFAGGAAPLLDANNQIVIGADGQPAQTIITSIERYRRTLLFQRQGLTPAQIRALGGGATQFSIAGGDPEARLNQAEFGFFIQDEWNLRPNLTLSLGLRYDGQSNVHRSFNLAPRFSFAFAPGGGGAASRTKTVIRGGFGIFFDRIAENLTLRANHLNGLAEQQFISSDPNVLGLFPAAPSLTMLANSVAPQTSVQVAPNIGLPYLMQGAISLERQLPLRFVFTATLLSTRGLHLLR